MNKKVKVDTEKLNSLISKMSKLTNREYQVVRLLNKQMSSKQIALALNISSHTVDCHRRNIISKLKIVDTRCLSFLKMD